MAHNKDKIIPGQGSQLNTHNRFDKLDRSGEAIYNDEPYNEDEGDKEKTQYIKIYPKTLINKVTSDL